MEAAVGVRTGACRLQWSRVDRQSMVIFIHESIHELLHTITGSVAGCLG